MLGHESKGVGRTSLDMFLRYVLLLLDVTRTGSYGGGKLSHNGSDIGELATLLEELQTAMYSQVAGISSS